MLLFFKGSNLKSVVKPWKFSYPILIFFSHNFPLKGPIYAYQKDKKGKVINQEAFCIAVGSPDTKFGTSCLDGHTVYCQFISGAAARWAVNIIIYEQQVQRKKLKREKNKIS